ncbi:MAG: septum formation initiator [Aeromicrobium sp.]|uniref:S1C family serine protease n=1 Tax=Aeromicrobium sp. TaxID=1871063 RepID=UPI002632ECC5|nr:trypsin-like peptidase domain-containing protein [Aeromicrobium sp.]MCW2823368.1 septum formation initiator [Aeromicrobium sp.]
MTEHLADPRRPHSTRRVVVAGIAACAIGLTGAGWATHAAATPATSATTTVRQPATTQQPTYGTFDGPPATTETTESAATDATSAQEVGLVYINTTLDYGTGKAAGTGMVLTADGEILTNHHVVEGATSISVEVVSTGRTYGADVVGYDSTHDVAVLQLEGASGLTPVTTDTTEQVATGNSVTGVGNANGDGGAASAAAGTVVALDQAITVSSETGGAASRLTGLIEVDADIIAGDSGGALYDDDGEVVGMNTAASSGAANVTGYAVPIAQALSIADDIESGTVSDTVVIGNHGYLGISLSSQVTGALVAGVAQDSPAADAGIATGSTVTGLNGASITSADALSEAVSRLPVGDRATVAWTDNAGQAHTATLTLGGGPVG